MSWVKLDDRFFDNPKIAPISDAAQLAYLKATCYCARELTDGFVALKKAREYATAKVIKELVPGLWEPCEGGFRVHDYLKYNPTRVKALAEREAARSRMFSRRSGEHLPNNEGTSEGSLDSPVKPVSPSFSDPPDPVEPTPQSHAFAPRSVVVGFEQCFGRLLSLTELELVKALMEEHPSERIEYALRESAALNKRSVRYIQRTCERIAVDGNGTSPGSGGTTAAKDTGRVANRVPGLESRSAGVARLGRRGPA